MSLNDTNQRDQVRRLPSLRYNLKSYKNFILRYKAYFSQDDDLCGIINGTFWEENGHAGYNIERNDVKRPIVATAAAGTSIQPTPPVAEGENQEQKADQEAVQQARIPPPPPQLPPDDIKKRCVKGNRKMYAILVPGMSEETNKILDGVPERDGKALWDAIIRTFDHPTRANVRRTLRDYFQLSQRKNERTSDYTHRSNQLISTIKQYGINIGAEIQLVVYLSGLLSKFSELKLTLELDENINYLMATEKLKDYDRVGEAGLTGNSSKSSTAFIADSKNSQLPSHNNNNRVIKDFSKYTCHACGEKGHLQRHCKRRHKLKCGYCSKKGHVDAVCRSRLRDQKASSNANLIEESSGLESDVAFTVVIDQPQDPEVPRDVQCPNLKMSLDVGNERPVRDVTSTDLDDITSAEMDQIDVTSADLRDIMSTTGGNDVTSADFKDITSTGETDIMSTAMGDITSNNGGDITSDIRPVKRLRSDSPTLQPPGGNAFTVSCNVSAPQSRDWIIDSGATVHICNNMDVFDSLTPLAPKTKRIKVASGKYIFGIGIGSVQPIQTTFYCPQASSNTLSVSLLLRDKFNIRFAIDKCYIDHPKHGSFEARNVDGLYRVSLSRAASALSVTGTNSAHLWHLRLGHTSHDRLIQLSRSKLIPGLNITRESIRNAPFCESCAKTKARHSSFAKTASNRPTRMLQTMCADVCGPVGTKSLAGAKYFVVCLCGYSTRAWVFFIATKDQAATEMSRFLTNIKGPKGEQPHTVVTDGGEFDSTHLTRMPWTSSELTMSLFRLTHPKATAQKDTFALSLKEHVPC